MKMTVDILVVGAGPVGLMCAYLGHLCGLKTMVVDKSDGPLQVGRADALNARTLQLLEVVNLFDELYPLGLPCNTSSVFAQGEFISRQSSWWNELEGCIHKHFLMLGQAHVEKLLDEKIQESSSRLQRSTSVDNIRLVDNGCETTLSNGETITSRYVIGADGSRSFVRNHFEIPFQVIKPQMVWAVIDGVLDTNFPKAPEIINFQTETSDVAWIPREGNIDRFYVRMDTKDFTIEEATQKIQSAVKPYELSFKEVIWFSQFSVKESVAEKFFVHDRIFLAGDASHIHSVNGGQGLNTGLADAFNLIWKINMVINHGASTELLQSYEDERLPVARSVVETSGELVRSTKFSNTGNHALDYVKNVQKRAGNITGMGIRYGIEGLVGQRLYDMELLNKERLYSHLDYSKFSLLVFGEVELGCELPDHVKLIRIQTTKDSCYQNQAILVRPDSYIEAVASLELVGSILRSW